MAGESDLAVVLDLALDQADRGEVNPVVALGEPGAVADGPVAAHFETAMIAVDGFMQERRTIGEAASAPLGEEQLDVLA